MAGNRTPSIPLRHARESGLSLIEIIIALFVFMLGVLGIFAIIPVAMHQSAQAIRTNRGGIIAQMAVAMAQYQMAGPHFEGTVREADPSGNWIVENTDQAWVTDQWKDYYLSFTDGKCIGLSRLIASNVPYTDPNPPNEDFEQIIVGTPFPATNLPDATSRYRIATFGVDASYTLVAPPTEPDSRGGLVSGIKETSGNQLPVDVNYQNWPTTGTFFILITSGRAAGRVCRLTLPLSGASLQGPAGFDFYKEGVRDGDGYYLIGNGSTIVSYPGNNFGTANAGQTLPDPSSTVATEYSYAIVVSDTSEMPDGAEAAPVRIDVLVFWNYDDSKTPANNKKAVAFQTAYLRPY